MPRKPRPLDPTDYAIDDVLDGGDATPSQLASPRNPLNGCRELAEALLKRAHDDRLALERYRRGESPAPRDVWDGWTPEDGEDAERWFAVPGSEERVGSLAWCRFVLRNPD